MPGARVDGVLLALIAVPIARVDDGVPPVDGVRGAGESSCRPWPWGERDAGARCRAGSLLEGTPVGRQSAIEQRGRMVGGPEHPHQACRDHTAGIVVRHDGGVIADTVTRHPFSERLGLGQRMAADGRSTLTGEPALQIDEHGSREVPVFVGGPTRATVQVPPHVHQGDIGVSALPVPPCLIDHGCDVHEGWVGCVVGVVVIVAPGGNANSDDDGDVENFSISKLTESDATLT